MSVQPGFSMKQNNRLLFIMFMLFCNVSTAEEQLEVMALGVGPIRSESKVDSQFLTKSFPGFSNKKYVEFYAEGTEGTAFNIYQGKALYMVIEVGDNFRPWRVTVKRNPVITPAKVSIGDTLEELEKRGGQIGCDFNLMEEGLYCYQISDPEKVFYSIDHIGDVGSCFDGRVLNRECSVWKENLKRPINQIVWSNL